MFITEAKETKIDGEYYRACDTFLHLGIPFKIYLHLMHICVRARVCVCVRVHFAYFTVSSIQTMMLEVQLWGLSISLNHLEIFLHLNQGSFQQAGQDLDS